MNEQLIEANITHRVVTGMAAGKAVIGAPNTADPLADGVVSWIELDISDMKGAPVRPSQAEWEVQIEVTAYSRSTTDRYAASKILEECLALLRNQVLEIKDFNEVGKPLIGYLTFYETAAGSVKQAGGDQWQIRNATITGTAKRIS